MPVPGMPTVPRVPMGPTLIVAPRVPIEVETPDLLTLRRMPGNSLIERRKRKPIECLSVLDAAPEAASQDPGPMLGAFHSENATAPVQLDACNATHRAAGDEPARLEIPRAAR